MKLPNSEFGINKIKSQQLLLNAIDVQETIYKNKLLLETLKKEFKDFKNLTRRFIGIHYSILTYQEQNQKKTVYAMKWKEDLPEKQNINKPIWLFT